MNLNEHLCMHACCAHSIVAPANLEAGARLIGAIVEIRHTIEIVACCLLVCALHFCLLRSQCSSSTRSVQESSTGEAFDGLTRALTSIAATSQPAR